MTLFEAGDVFSLNKTRPKKFSSWLQIQSEKEILSQSLFRKELLQSMKNLFPSKEYDSLYLPAIEQFAAYTQNLPDFENSLFNRPGGLLDHGLLRAFKLIQLSIHYYDKKNLKELTSKEALEVYAAFTAALFLNISQLIVNYEVILNDHLRDNTKTWRPFEGSMEENSQVSFYRFKYNQPSFLVSLGQACLASIIFSKSKKTQMGFHWIVSDLKILESWLAILIGDMTGGSVNKVIALIPFADKKAIDEKLRLLSKRFNNNFIGKFYDSAIVHEEHFPVQWKAGEQFLYWLRERIKLKTININNHSETGLKITQAGILIARSELIDFSARYHLNAQLIEAQFREIESLYPISLNEKARRSSEMGGLSQVGLSQWLLVQNPALLFGIGSLPYLSIQNNLKI